MASRGQSITVVYYAFDTVANAYKTGDVANHAIRVIKDGTDAAATNSPAEVSSANDPGAYKLVLTASECTADSVVVSGKSSTANIIIIPRHVTFENLPTAAPAASGGLPTGDANNRVKAQATIQKNVAKTNFGFVMTDSSTHAPVTGKTVAVTRDIRDGNGFITGGITNIAEEGNGWYRCDFAASDLNADQVFVRATSAGADDTNIELFPQP